MKKRLIAFLLCCIMLLGTLAGCGGGTAGEETTPETNNANEGATVGQEETAGGSVEFDPRSVTEGVKLTVCVPMDPNVADWETNEMTLAIEERLGVDLEFVVYASANYGEKLNVMVNGGDELPDIILGSNTTPLKSVNEWAEEGVLVDLVEYFANPDYAASMHDMMEATGADIVGMTKTLEGNVWGYPSYWTDLEGTVAYNMLINEKFLEVLGAEVPTTTDEFLELARAFKAAGDVNGNGKDDEVFFTGRGDNLRWFNGLMTSFVYAWGNNYLINEDGTLEFAYTTDEWKEGLKWMRTLMEEELIDPGVLTNDKSAYNAIRTADPDVRIMSDFYYWALEVSSSSNEALAQFIKPVFLTSPVNSDVKSYYAPPTPAISAVITTDCENPLAAFLVLDLIASRDEFSMMNRVGKKGENWDYWCDLPDSWFAERNITRADYEIVKGANDDGEHVVMEYNSLLNQPQNVMWQRTGPIFYFDIDISRAYLTSDADGLKYTKARAEASVIAANGYLPGDLLVTANQVEMTADEKAQYADTFAALNSYVKESIGSFLTGTWDIDTYWDTYMAELEKIGVKDALEMYQSAYDRKN